MTTLVFLVMALLVGALLPVQAGLNASLAGHLGHPLPAALVNFAVGGLALFGASLVFGTPLPTPQAFARSPPWLWLGGLCGVSLVVTAIVAAPRLGAAALMACLIGGQMLSSVLLDHFGWLGYAPRPLSGGRAVGIAALALGVWLIRRG